MAITATLEDPDVVVRSSVEWKWAVGNGNISGATSATFKPTGAQVGQTLTAKASYSDGHGENKMADGDSFRTVQLTDTGIDPPEFKDDQDQALTSLDRSVDENTAAPGTVGAPVTAMDDDVLTYSLEGRDARSFDIDRASGQIKVGEGTSLDFETRTTYTVIVKAKDASNLTDTVTVNIAVDNVDEDPEITAGPMTVEYAENRADAVATYTATDPEDDRASPRKPLNWTLTGNDEGFMSIEGGTLTFKVPPDFEDARVQNSDNVYDVTVVVTDSDDQTDTRFVTVTVTNVEEPGTVTLSAQEPQEEIPLTATLSDPDNVTTASDKWQWARSRTRSSGWTDIVDEDDDAVGKTATYMPVNDDVGYYLRATVTYKDGESAADVQENDKTAQAVSTNPVRKTPYLNSAPVFQDDEGEEITTGVQRSVAENSRAGTAVGDPVAATDPGEFGPDTLTYTLSDNDAASFDINSGTGQIRVKAGKIPDFETTPSYTVTVTAKDPSDTETTEFEDSITVTIMVTDVDETPMFTPGDTEVDHDENDSSNPVTYVPAVATYTATDPEDDQDGDKNLKWSLSGIDGGKFAISDAGALTFMTPPDYEAPVDSGRNNDYNLRVEVTDSGGNTATRVVTVTVDNIDEPGVVTQSNLQPEDGKTITASLTDPDGIVSGPTWQWATTTGQQTEPLSDDHIEDATFSTYKPVAGNVNRWLWAIASYTDGQGQNKTAMVASGYVVRAATTTNEPPMVPRPGRRDRGARDRSDKDCGGGRRGWCKRGRRGDGHGRRHRRRTDIHARRRRHELVRHRQENRSDHGRRRDEVELRVEGHLRRHGHGHGLTRTERNHHGDDHGYQRERVA